MFSPFYKEKTGEALKKEARKLGVSFDELGSNSGIISEPILQQRVREAKNTRFAKLTWIIAFTSFLVSVFSAIVSWIAISRT